MGRFEIINCLKKGGWWSSKDLQVVLGQGHTSVNRCLRILRKQGLVYYCRVYFVGEGKRFLISKYKLK